MAEQIRVLVQARPLPGAVHRLCIGIMAVYGNYKGHGLLHINL